YNPKIIINCIGNTGGSNVDGCEDNKQQTLLANTFIPIMLGDRAFRRNIKLVHISSGCIYHFDYAKRKPISEEDKPDFFDLFYSRSKIYAERALMGLLESSNILITRIRIPLDNKPHPKNILTKILKFQRVIDVPNSITYIPDFIEMLKHLIKIDAKGIYNAVNKNPLRYPEILEVYKKYVPDYNYKTMSYKELNLVRTNLVMSVAKLESTGFKVRDIHDVLEECVKSYLNKQ
ncbi:MAG: sugar nucleotide-binding protein, partial [Candidatus Omnitrophica bacterium]|nr:sugar nucleotide-binding protein [Candidatus Omnitrophota bacterium]